MTQAPAAIFKIPTESPQPAPGKAAKPSGRAKKCRRRCQRSRPGGEERGRGPQVALRALPQPPRVRGGCLERDDAGVELAAALRLLDDAPGEFPVADSDRDPHQLRIVLDLEGVQRTSFRRLA
jgi:hypothetical protein